MTKKEETANTSYTRPKMPTREAIIGLGEDSIRKNYYPELQDKLLDLERINARNRALITTIPDILLVSDLEGHISPLTMSSGTGSMNPLVIAIMRNQPILEQIRQSIRVLLATRSMITIDLQLNWLNTTLYLEARMHLSELNEILIIIRDMTERISMEMQLRRLAERDSLTGLFNRRVFEEKMEVLNNGYTNSLTLILIDIDGLKLVNDTLGHAAGDSMLRSIASLIAENFGSDAILARVGGDEFGILIENGSAEQSESNLLRLHSHLRRLHQKNQEQYPLSLSWGYAHRERIPTNLQLMFQEADNNMYQNKLLKDGSARNNLVKALKLALEAKDYITEGHADRMETLATAIGSKLNMTQNELDRLRLLTKFHDIGKVGIPDSILKKEGPLTEDEWKIMKTHANIGERIARESAELEVIAPLILRHHERWDGKGYPLGIKQDEIPTECRILSIVDTYDAMTNDRPYRRALPAETAVTEIINQSGSQFDPELVNVFVEITKLKS